jgi:hypothetical protein
VRGQVVADVDSPGAVVQGNQVFRGEAGATGVFAGPP